MSMILTPATSRPERKSCSNCSRHPLTLVNNHATPFPLHTSHSHHTSDITLASPHITHPTSHPHPPSSLLPRRASCPAPPR
eukprot:3049313-Rhodomonas_salina.1